MASKEQNHTVKQKKQEEFATICSYFGLKRNKSIKVRIWDLHSGIPLPMLTYIIHKLLPSTSIGAKVPQSHITMDKIKREFYTLMATGSHPEGLQLTLISSPEDLVISDADIFIVPNKDNLPKVDVYDYGVADKWQKSNIANSNEITSDENFKTPYPGFVVMTPKGMFTPLNKHIYERPNVYKELISKLEISEGPSMKTTAMELPNKDMLEIDLVYAFPVDGWPLQAQDWISRERPHNWPNSTLRKQIVQQGIHYVKKPPQNLPQIECNLQDFYWRLSFSLAERNLAASFNDTQRQCAVLLKILKEVKGLPKDVLTSYHMKTIMFWMCEKIPSRAWRPEKISTCLLAVLDYLILCLARRNIPHYFIPEVNLLSGKSKESTFTALKVVKHYRLHLFNFLAPLGESYMRWYNESGVSMPNTLSGYKSKVEEDILNAYTGMNLLVELLLILSDLSFRQNNSFMIFRERMTHIEHGVNILNEALSRGISTLTPILGKIVDVTAVDYFTENNIRPYYLHVMAAKAKMLDQTDSKPKSIDYHSTTAQHQQEVDFYRTLKKSCEGSPGLPISAMNIHEAINVY